MLFQVFDRILRKSSLQYYENTAWCLLNRNLQQNRVRLPGLTPLNIAKKTLKTSKSLKS